MAPIQKIPSGTYNIGPRYTHELDHPGIIRTTLRDQVENADIDQAAKGFFALMANAGSILTAYPWLWKLDMAPISDLGWAAIDGMNRWLAAFKDQGRRGDTPPTLIAIVPRSPDRIFLEQAASHAGLSPRIYAETHPAAHLFRNGCHERLPKS